MQVFVLIHLQIQDMREREMGSTQSRNKTQVFYQCKERKRFMEEAISSWKAFATAHSAYTMALKNIGAAFSDYSKSIVEDIHSSSISLVEPPTNTPLPSPLPFPSFSPSHFNCPTIPEEDTGDGLEEDMESMPMPSLSQHKETKPENDEVDEERFKRMESIAATPSVRSGADEPAQHQQADASESKRGKIVAEIMNDLDEHFLEASKSAHQVSKMLEAPRFDTKIDYSALVMRAIMLNSSSERIPRECETHASILEWEQRFYNEVKACELMKTEYQRKVASLNVKRKKRGVTSKALEKSEAAVSHFHTRYIVCTESVDSVVSEINRLRDDLLYLKLVYLVDGMSRMWETMHVHHDNQVKIASDHLKTALDTSFSLEETSQQHHQRTALLWQMLREWCSQFQKLMSHQRDYVRALNGWLQLNLLTVDSSLKEKVTSPPVQALLKAWQDEMEKLPNELGEGPINDYLEVIRSIMTHQEDELRLREECEEVMKKYIHKGYAFEEKEAVVESCKGKLENEVDSYERMCKLVREEWVGSLTIHLAELFRAMSEFALACSLMYKKLRSIAWSQNPVVN